MTECNEINDTPDGVGTPASPMGDATTSIGASAGIISSLLSTTSSMLGSGALFLCNFAEEVLSRVGCTPPCAYNALITIGDKFSIPQLQELSVPLWVPYRTFVVMFAMFCIVFLTFICVVNVAVCAVNICGGFGMDNFLVRMVRDYNKKPSQRRVSFSGDTRRNNNNDDDNQHRRLEAEDESGSTSSSESE